MLFGSKLVRVELISLLCTGDMVKSITCTLKKLFKKCLMCIILCLCDKEDFDL